MSTKEEKMKNAINRRLGRLRYKFNNHEIDEKHYYSEQQFLSAFRAIFLTTSNNLSNIEKANNLIDNLLITFNDDLPPIDIGISDSCNAMYKEIRHNLNSLRSVINENFDDYNNKMDCNNLIDDLSKLFDFLILNDEKGSIKVITQTAKIELKELRILNEIIYDEKR